MTKLIASLAGLAVVLAVGPALAECAAHQQTVQSTPVMTSKATTVPMTPAPSTTETKAGS